MEVEVSSFIDKSEIKIGDRTFLVSKLPAIAGQEVYGKIMRYSQGIGDLAMTFLPKDIAVDLLSYAAVKAGEEWVTLDSEIAINSACKTIEELIDLEAEMIRKNFGFLFDGKLQKVLDALRGTKEDI